MLQFEKPAAHVDVHTPAVHEAVVTLVDAQARPQPPQLAVSAATEVSHPSAFGAATLQSANPEAQPV